MRRTDFRLEAPASIYDRLEDGRLVFYRNLRLAPDLQLFDQRRKAWLPMRRLFAPDESGWAFLCIHPYPVCEKHRPWLLWSGPLYYGHGKLQVRGANEI